MATFKYELGSKAQCRITGYAGIITARTEWLYGCRRYTLQARQLAEGKPVESLYLDEDAVELFEAAEPHEAQATGGDAPPPQRPSAPKRHG